MEAFVYFLRLRSAGLYIGTTTNLEQRLSDHVTGKGGLTTRRDPPTTLRGWESFSTFTAARHREAQLKGWSRAREQALIRGDATALRTLSRSHD